ANLSLVSSGNADPSDYLDKIIQDKQFILKLFDHRWFYQEDTLPLETILKINKDTLSANWQHIYMMSKVEAIRKNGLLKIRKDTKTGVLALTSKMPDPRLTHDINLFTLDFISNFIRNSIQTQAKEKRLFIEEQLKKVKAELQKSENNLTEYKERNIMSQTPRSMLEEARLLRQVNLNQEIYLQYHKQYELVRVEELDDQTLIQVLKNPEIPILRSEPKRKIIVVIAFIIGTIAGLISVILFNYAPKFSYWMKADSNYNSNLKV
ncbi:MAG: hypothetical protein GX638_08095, partial [Crenarchaeota archaeon]|nr:hypothetical protein [Thermoproteota archaeon]